MTIILTAGLMKQIFPLMSEAQAKVFVDKQAVMSEILSSVDATAIAFANVYAEGAYNARKLPYLTEDILYTPARMAAVWPNRFPGGASDVIAKYGTGPDWRIRAFDDIYGGRNGNRPGTHDGSSFIGRGGPQLTGRGTYAAMGLGLENNPQLAASPDMQPAILAAFWKWKGMGRFVASGAAGIPAGRHAWNGGSNGLAVVQSQYARIKKLLVNHNPVSAAINIQPQRAEKDPVLEEIQQRLVGFGYYEVGKPDGFTGGRTNAAIKAFFTDRGITVKAEYPSDILIAEIDKAEQENWHRPIAPSRAFATQAELAPQVASVAPTKSAGLFAKVGAWFSGVVGTIKGAVWAFPDLNDQATPYIGILQQWFSDIPSWVYFAGIAIVAIFIVRQTTKANNATVADYQQGKIN